MHPTLLQKLKEYGIKVLGDNPKTAQFGIGKGWQPMILEAPIQFRNGVFEADEIGAFTYLGGADWAPSVLRHIARIGRFCSIAGGISAGSVEHPTDFLSTSNMFYANWSAVWPETKEFYQAYAGEMRTAAVAYKNRVLNLRTKIEVGNDVWIGEGAFIIRGVKIGDGAIIAAHSVVTKDVPPYGIVGGVPAKLIRFRFDEAVVERLLKIRWWDYGLSALRGADHSNIHHAMDAIEAAISEGRAQLYRGKRIQVNSDGSAVLLEND